MQKLYAIASLVVATTVGAALPVLAQGEGAIYGTVKARPDGEPRDERPSRRCLQHRHASF